LETFDVGVHESLSFDWYQPYIDFVHDTAIFSRYALRPSVFMTRGQMAYLVHRLMLHDA